MSPWARIAAWWAGGDLLMPVLLLAALVLYTLLAERTACLWRVRPARRRGELEALLAPGDAAWRRWAAGHLAAAEAAELGRALPLIRALTACLPLLGLLGTVSGMVDTFAALAGPRAEAARAAGRGIGLALTATQYGLALALPALLWERLLVLRIAALVRQRGAVAQGMIAR